jgi:putative tryptophan/tyrosine transport system substrate-binding protein
MPSSSCVTAIAAQGRCHCHVVDCRRRGCQAGYIHHPNRFRGGGGPGRHRPGCESGASGRHVTGLSVQQTDLAAKRIELLREVVPGLRRLAILGNVGGDAVVLDMREVQTTARPLGLEVITLEIRRGEDIVPAFEALKGRADALYVCIDPLVVTHRIRINTLALAARLPTMHGSREYVEVGGLMSYGPNFPDLFRRAADYVDKILRGTKPADLPLQQPTKFDLVINLTTANALGVTIAPTLLARANEVIE